MWLAEFLFIVGFYVAGAVLMPTATSDSVARKRGTEDSNKLKRETIRRAVTDFKIDNPQVAQLYTASMVTLVVGVAMVLLFDIAALGYILQAVSLSVFVLSAIKKREYVRACLQKEGLGRRSD